MTGGSVLIATMCVSVPSVPLLWPRRQRRRAGAGVQARWLRCLHGPQVRRHKPRQSMSTFFEHRAVVAFQQNEANEEGWMRDCMWIVWKLAERWTTMHASFRSTMQTDNRGEINGNRQRGRGNRQGGRVQKAWPQAQDASRESFLFLFGPSLRASALPVRLLLMFYSESWETSGTAEFAKPTQAKTLM